MVMDRAARIAEVQRLHDEGGMTQRQIAARVGCAQGSVSLWTRGLYTPWRCERCGDPLIRPQPAVCGLCAEETATAQDRAA